MTKLYRSTRDKKLFGLCGGIAEAFNIDATILRLIVAIGVVFSGGTVLLLYIVACLVIPKEPTPFGSAPQPGFGGSHWNHGSMSHHSHTTHASQQHTASSGQQPPSAASAQPASNIDDMMKDIEKKAMQKEIEELKARLAKLEKGDE